MRFCLCAGRVLALSEQSIVGLCGDACVGACCAEEPDSPVLRRPVPDLAHMWLAAPDSAYEGERLLVEIVLADGQGRRLSGIQSVRLRPSEERSAYNERVHIENGRGSTASTGLRPMRQVCILRVAPCWKTARI